MTTGLGTVNSSLSTQALASATGAESLGSTPTIDRSTVGAPSGLFAGRASEILDYPTFTKLISSGIGPVTFGGSTSDIVRAYQAYISDLGQLPADSPYKADIAARQLGAQLAINQALARESSAREGRATRPKHPPKDIFDIVRENLAKWLKAKPKKPAPAKKAKH